MNGFAAVDFCGTIAKFQTLDPYLEFVLKKERHWLHRMVCNPIFKTVLLFVSKVLRKLGYRKYLYKELLVFCTKGITDNCFQILGKEYYYSRVKDHLIPETVKILSDLKDSGYEIVILSAGSHYYIDYFAKEHGIDQTVTAVIDFRKGKSNGRIKWECVGEEKEKFIRKYLLDKKIDTQKTIGITDSSSDLPMLSACNRKIILSHKCHQSWIQEDMEEIIWG